MKRQEITEIKSQLPTITSIDDYHKHIILRFPLTGLTAMYSYDTLITYKFQDKPRILTSDWDYSRTTTKYLSQYLNKNKAEIKKAITNFEYILEDNPCLN